MKRILTIVAFVFVIVLTGCSSKEQSSEDINLSIQYMGLEETKDSFSLLTIDTTEEKDIVSVEYNFMQARELDETIENVDDNKPFEYQLVEVVDKDESLKVVTKEKTFEFEKLSDSVLEYKDDGEQYQYSFGDEDD